MPPSPLYPRSISSAKHWLLISHKVCYRELLLLATLILFVSYIAPTPSRSNARQRLTLLTIYQFYMLSTDVYDELVRRNEDKEGGYRLVHLSNLNSCSAFPPHA